MRFTICPRTRCQLSFDVYLRNTLNFPSFSTAWHQRRQDARHGVRVVTGPVGQVPFIKQKHRRPVHTLCCRTHIFSAWRTDITHTLAQGLSVMKKVCCAVHVVSLRLALSILMFHPPSLLYPEGDLPWYTACSSFVRPKIAGHAHSHTSGEEFVCMGDSAQSTGYEPKLLDKNICVDDDMTPINDPDHDSISDFSKTTREGTRFVSVPTVCELFSLSNVSWGNDGLPKEKPASGNRARTERKRGKRTFCD